MTSMAAPSSSNQRNAGGHRPPLQWRPYSAGACALAIAFGLKAFYSRAGATELLWILAPSAWLARFVGGIDLAYEQGAGFISRRGARTQGRGADL